MNLADIILATLAAAAESSPGTLTHAGNVYAVFRSFGPVDVQQMVDVGFDQEVADVTVLCKAIDIADPAPAAGDEVTLDGEAFAVGRRVTKTPIYWILPLRALR